MITIESWDTAITGTTERKAIRNWLQKLNSATYEVDDVLDECAAKAIMLQIGQKVKDAIRKLDGIADERIKFHLSEVTAKKQSPTDEVRETGFVLIPAEVYGREDDKRKIVEILMNHIHNLAHDLAQSIMDDGIHATKLEGGENISASRIRQLKEVPSAIGNLIHLRSSQLRKFPSLESLEICNLPDLKGVSIEEGEEQFPSFHEMWIEDCPLLTFPRLLSLRKLRNMKCSNMTLASISNLCGLTCLEIANNKELTSFPEEVLTYLTNLEILSIGGFTKLEVLPSSLASLTALKSLHIGYCNQLESLPEQGLQGLTSVRTGNIRHLASLNSLHCVHLDGLPMFHSGEDTITHPEELALWQLPEALLPFTICNLCVCRFPSLTLLPEWLGELTSLKELNILQCDNLGSLPECMERMNLQSLNILFCAILDKRCEPGQGEDCYKIFSKSENQSAL
ncbi:hypothetical protein RND71_012123 [Anisodus tanguticus]|uniref:Rx N-terminal domain-containing protein n=1 Tax=Anisodus tanguticus TaxID=243964 RepID=A0AAE1SGD9_9SOLA|nr:hypothetical protein RND71_012123 [Anisodus tanguticus]